MKTASTPLGCTWRRFTACGMNAVQSLHQVKSSFVVALGGSLAKEESICAEACQELARDFVQFTWCRSLLVELYFDWGENVAMAVVTQRVPEHTF